MSIEQDIREEAARVVPRGNPTGADDRFSANADANARREERAAVMATMLAVHQRRTQGGPWTPRDQLAAEYIMAWTDSLA